MTMGWVAVLTAGIYLAQRSWDLGLWTGIPLAAVRARIVELLDSGQLGSSEDERQVLRLQIAEILGRREGTEEDKGFALGFAVHTICDSRRFRDFFSSLREGMDPVEEPEPAKAESKAKPKPKPLTETDEGDDSELLEVSTTGLGPDDSGSGRPKTGSHPAINLNAGPLPLAKDR